MKKVQNDLKIKIGDEEFEVLWLQEDVSFDLAVRVPEKQMSYLKFISNHQIKVNIAIIDNDMTAERSGKATISFSIDQQQYRESNAVNLTCFFDACAKKETGGPAFPMAKNMTLRDYFAAKAMQSLLKYAPVKHNQEIALSSYEIADAMLKEREK